MTPVIADSLLTTLSLAPALTCSQNGKHSVIYIVKLCKWPANHRKFIRRDLN